MNETERMTPFAGQKSQEVGHPNHLDDQREGSPVPKCFARKKAQPKTGERIMCEKPIGR